MDLRLSLFTRVKQFLRRVFSTRFGNGSDPFTGVRAPTRLLGPLPSGGRGPGGRSSAGAVAEPDEDRLDMSAVGVRRERARR
jgi:hypothetical protein